MAATYIEKEVERVNRNLMLVNGGILALFALFFAFMMLGGVMRQRSHEQLQAYGAAHSANAIYRQPAALDSSHPTRISAAEVASTQRLEELAGHAVTFSDPQAQNLMFPVWNFMGRVTGKNKPHIPPYYHVSSAGGKLLLILPDKSEAGTTFTGVIRPLADVDFNAVHPALMARGFQQELQPFILDCLSLSPPDGAAPLPVVMHPVGNGGRGFPSYVVVFGLLATLCGWNVVKAFKRIKSPLTHPIYTKLAQYGSPPDLVRAIEAERQAGVTVLAPAQFIYSWMLIPSFWSLDVVPLDQLAWVFKMVTFVNFIPMMFSLRVLDREGKGHPISTSDAQMTRIMDYIGQVRPWVMLGYSRERRDLFSCDRARFLAEIDARRRQFQPVPMPAPVPLSGYPAPRP